MNNQRKIIGWKTTLHTVDNARKYIFGQLSKQEYKYSKAGATYAPVYSAISKEEKIKMGKLKEAWVAFRNTPYAWQVATWMFVGGFTSNLLGRLL